MALLAAVIVIALVIYTVVRLRRRREAAHAELLNQQEHIEHISSADHERRQ
jgi:preprotein translocase subunit YajC